MRIARSLTVLLLAGCGVVGGEDHLFGQRRQAEVAPRTPTLTQKFKAGAPSARELDVLWVVDNSGSMELKQNKLRAALPGFIDALEARAPGLSWRMGVVTTDTVNPSESGRLQNRAALSKPWVDADTCVEPCDPVEALRQNLSVGIKGSGDEKPLLAAQLALERDEGFRRPSAPLLVIVVTDEEDTSCAPTKLEFGGGCTPPLTWGAPEYWARMFVPPPGEGPRRLAVIAALTQASLGGDVVGCRSVDNENDIAVHAPRLISLAQATGGLAESICEAELAPGLDRIAAQILPPTAYTLDRVPLKDSLKVTVTLPGGAPQTMVPDIDFHYSRCVDGQPFGRLRFTPTHMPPEGSVVEVSYAVDATTDGCS